MHSERTSLFVSTREASAVPQASRGDDGPRIEDRYSREVSLTSLVRGEAVGVRSKPLVLTLAICASLAAESRPQAFFADDFVQAHNSYREQLGLPALAWSPQLAARAQQWALYLIQTGSFGPRRDGVFGENLYEISGGYSSPAAVVAAWMSEGRNYNRNTNTCSARCGHFTQVVWRDTRFIGCAVARDRSREIWVCNYDPHGNVQGERPY